jgi:hypothetical protein
LVEKIIATAFNIEEFVEQFNIQKVTYRTYIDLCYCQSTLFCLLRHNLHNFSANNNIYSSYIQRYNLFDFNKKYQNLIFGKFILFYIFASRNSPYFFMYYLIAARESKNMKVKTILSQPEPKVENSPYFELQQKHKVKIDFRPLFI